MEQYLVKTNGKARADDILSDIDRRFVVNLISVACVILTAGRLAVVPHFPKLRKFHEGRGFKQWTGDDSKALMKVNSR